MVWRGRSAYLEDEPKARRQPWPWWESCSCILFLHKVGGAASVFPLYIHEITNHHFQLYSLADNQGPILQPTALIATVIGLTALLVGRDIPTLGPPSSKSSYQYVFFKAEEGPL